MAEQYRVKQLVKTAKHIRTIDTASLSPERKKLLWAGIKQLEPDLAEMLQLDIDLKQIKTSMQASLHFSQADFDRFTKAGRLIIGETV